MPVFSQHRTSTRALCALLALLVCFFSVALYSPLHVHKNRQCSLNNLEYQIADSVTPVLDLPQPVDEAIAILIEESIATPVATVSAQTSRGPPAVSFS